MVGKAGKTTKRGLGKTGKPSERRVETASALSCPPPKADVKDRRRGSSLASRNQTLRRHGSSPTAVTVDDLAVVVRLSASATLKLAHGKSLDGAPIEPREAFFLSRVDGHSTVEDLADLTGMKVTEALAIARKLLRLDLVHL